MIGGIPFSRRHALILPAAMAFCGLLWLRGEPGLAVVYSAYASTLIFLAVVDLESRRIPSSVVYLAGALALAASIAIPGAGSWRLALLGGVVGGGVMGLAYLGSHLFKSAVARWRKGLEVPSALGFGDVRLGVLIGLMVGMRLVMPAIVLGLALGGCGALVYWVVEGAVRHRYRAFSTMPLGPYLAAGTIVVMVVGESVIAWL